MGETDETIAFCVTYLGAGVKVREEFWKPLAVSQYRLAKDINVDPRRINEIVLGKRAITADP